MNRGIIVATPAALGLIAGGNFLPDAKKEFNQTHRRPAVYSQAALPQSPTFSVSTQALIDEHCGESYGRPELSERARALYGLTLIVPHEGYVVEQSVIDKIPLWICEKVTTERMSGPGDRKDKFIPDPLVPLSYQAKDKDYSRSGYDRGHQAPSDNYKSSQRLNDETFYFTNMSPQAGYLNRQIWKRLEQRLQTFVSSNEPMFVISGPLFYDPQEELSGFPADGLVEYYSIGRGGVSVPTHFYKILLQRHDGVLRALAFVFENKEDYDRPSVHDYNSNIQSIDWIEERTGIDFFPELSEEDEAQVESVRADNWVGLP